MDQVNDFLEKMKDAIAATIEGKEGIEEYLSAIFTSKNRWTRDNYKDKVNNYNINTLISFSMISFQFFGVSERGKLIGN